MEAGGVNPVRVFPNAAALAEAAATGIVATLNEAIDTRGRAWFALAGGTTPAGVYRRLAAEPWSTALPWEHVEFLFGDERCVPPQDDASNFRMARETLFEPLGIAAIRVHRIPGELPPQDAADRYETALRTALGGARCDLVLLGLGEDGHTASLFPGSPALHEETRWVVPSESPVAPRPRVTLTLPFLNDSRRVVFLASGGHKAPAVAAVLSQAPGPVLPARRVQPRRGSLAWYLDAGSAAQLASR